VPLRASLLFWLALALPALEQEPEKVIKVQAKKYEFIPPVIELQKGVPVVLEFVSLDRKHGARQKELGIDLEITPDKPARVRLLPEKEGKFDFSCSVFCGSGHEEMGGVIVVKP
jgi:cytochrome c oxidase subunit 2